MDAWCTRWVALAPSLVLSSWALASDDSMGRLANHTTFEAIPSPSVSQSFMHANFYRNTMSFPRTSLLRSVFTGLEKSSRFSVLTRKRSICATSEVNAFPRGFPPLASICKKKWKKICNLEKNESGKSSVPAMLSRSSDGTASSARNHPEPLTLDPRD